MKRIFVFLVVIVCLFVFVGCDASQFEAAVEEAEKTSSLFEMECLTPSVWADGIYYHRDKATDVIYIVLEDGYRGGLTAMLDPETGLPLTYSKYMELYSD